MARKNIHNITLSEELEELKLKYDRLKSSYEEDIASRNQAEDELKKRSQLLSSITQYSIELSEQDYTKIQKFIVNRFLELFKVRGVWITSYDEMSSELILQSSTTTEKENTGIMNFLGKAIKRYRTIIDDEKYRLMVESGVKMFSSLHEISFGQIPEIVGSAIEKLLGIGWFQGIALTENGKLYGTLVVAGFKGQDELPADAVKIFAELTSSILKRKETGDKLKTSEDKFRKIFITSPDSININRLDNGEYVSINHGFTMLMGYTEKEVLGKTPFELNIWENDEDREKLVKELLKKGVVENLEARFRMKNGSVKDGIMSAALIDLDGEQHVMSITRDITDRKHDEEQLRKSEEKYRLLAENISDVIWVLDAETMYFIYVSPSVERLRGYTPEEIIKQPVAAALTDEGSKILTRMTQERAKNILEGREAPGSFFINEVEQPCKDGSTVWTEVITSFYINQYNGRVEVLGVTRDITGRKKIEETLRQTEINSEINQRKKIEVEVYKINAGLEKRVAERTAQLEAANSELQAFAYSVSHDLRAPLRAIDGFSKFVEEDYAEKLDPEGKRLLGLIRSNTKKMDKLITDILSLSRVTRSEHKKSKIDMTKMAVSMYNEVVSSESNQLNFIIDNLPLTFADSTSIKQVWINLISNAVKFSSLSKNPQITIGGYEEEGFHCYFVKDNGVGFNPEYSSKLFGVFQRLHRSDEFEGTGVGLAIVQRIIHRHGGKVWAEGKEGEGATFYFALPIK